MGHPVPKSFILHDADFVAVDNLSRLTGGVSPRGSMQFGALVDPLRPVDPQHLIFIDAALDDASKALVSGLVMNGENLLFGPKAADDFTWELKPQANARGYLFEVAQTSASLRRLFQTSLAAVQHKAALERKETATVSPRHALEDDLAELPGVVAATQFLRPKQQGLDAEVVRELFGLSRADLARVTGFQQETIRKTPDSERLQMPLGSFERIARLLTLNPDRKQFLSWLNSPNSELDDKTPLKLIKEKKGHIVESLVYDVLTNRGR
jgi:hypothetical protein